MAQSTGPILTVGAITWANMTVLAPTSPQDMFASSTRVAVATGIAAGGLALVERASPELAKGIAWVALVSILFTRIGNRPSPSENLLRWWNEGAPPSKAGSGTLGFKS